jgi:hypothetical protein
MTTDGRNGRHVALPHRVFPPSVVLLPVKRGLMDDLLTQRVRVTG